MKLHRIIMAKSNQVGLLVPDRIRLCHTGAYFHVLPVTLNVLQGYSCVSQKGLCSMIVRNLNPHKWSSNVSGQAVIAEPSEIFLFPFNQPLHFITQDTLTQCYPENNNNLLPLGTAAKETHIKDALTYEANPLEEQKPGCLTQCVINQLGISTILEVSAIGSGAPVIKSAL